MLRNKTYQNFLNIQTILSISLLLYTVTLNLKIVLELVFIKKIVCLSLNFERNEFYNL